MRSDIIDAKKIPLCPVPPKPIFRFTKTGAKLPHFRQALAFGFEWYYRPLSYHCAPARRAGGRGAQGGREAWGRGRELDAFSSEVLQSVIRPQGGPLYLQLKRWIEARVGSGDIRPGDALPSERDLAQRVDVSRVTVRKAVQQLVRDGLLIQRHGSGTYVADRPQRVEQTLSQLTSFTEDMARRGLTVRSEVLERGLHTPSVEETMVLGLRPGERVARLSRLRLTDDTPLAIERAALSEGVLPDPSGFQGSLYTTLEKTGNRPSRAIQRIRAANIEAADAALLRIPVGSAALYIERIAYLPTGRPIEFTRSVYRGDTYDFVAELRVGEAQNR